MYPAPDTVPNEPQAPSATPAAPKRPRGRHAVSIPEIVATVATTAAAVAALTVPWYEATYVPKVGGVNLPELGNAASKTITATAWESGWLGKGAVVALLAAAVAHLLALALPRAVRWKGQLTALVPAAAGLALTAAANGSTPTIAVPVETFSGDPRHTAVTLSYATQNAFGLTLAIALSVIALVAGIAAVVVAIVRRRDGLLAPAPTPAVGTSGSHVAGIGSDTFHPAPHVPTTVLEETSPFLYGRF